MESTRPKSVGNFLCGGEVKRDCGSIRCFPAAFLETVRPQKHTDAQQDHDPGKLEVPGHGLGRDWHLYVPPHHFEGAQTLVIGLGDPPRPVPDIDFGLEVNFAAMGPPARLLEAARRGRVDVVADTVAFGIPVDLADARGNRALLLTSLATLPAMSGQPLTGHAQGGAGSSLPMQRVRHVLRSLH